MTIRSLPVSELRANLASVLSDVEAGQRVLLTRHDRVVAALVPPSADRLTPLEARAAELLADIARPAPDELPPVVDHPSIDPERWVAEIMADRG